MMLQSNFMLKRGAVCSFSVWRYYKTLTNGIPGKIQHLAAGKYQAPGLTERNQQFESKPLLSSVNVSLPRVHASAFSSKDEPDEQHPLTPGGPTPLSPAVTKGVLVEHYSQKVLYNDILDEFPAGIQMAFAYGSGAVQQKSSLNKDKNMLDFIFVVDRPTQWHRLNMERHPHHYSALKHLGCRTVSRIQERYGAGVYFNTLVHMKGRVIKYGVISTTRLIADLLDWDTLYVAGRLHKPVALIIMPTDEYLITAMKMNLKSAVHAALLLLPDLFTEEQLYMCIASLSYAGDFRMAIGEDNNKVKNIVEPNMKLLRRMYGPFVDYQEHVTWWQEEGQLEQALNLTSRHHHLTRLPAQVMYSLLKRQYQVGKFPDLEEMIELEAHDAECGEHVAQCLRGIVKRSSLSQSVKGILTAGFTKSVRYSSSKVLKKIKSTSS